MYSQMQRYHCSRTDAVDLFINHDARGNDQDMLTLGLKVNDDVYEVQTFVITDAIVFIR